MDQPQEAIMRIREKSGVKGPWLHDVRRTVRTRLPRLGISPDTAERVLGHALPAMRRAYDRHDYLPQTQTALQAWGQELDRILAHSNERPLRLVTRPVAVA